jgi:hypothetical protein
MAVQPSGKIETEDLLASRQAIWASFIRWSTWAIVGIAILLILMALFLV